MRALPDGLAAHVAGEATTLCQCWRLTLADGTRLGFTDHDRDLVFDGTLFEAASGLSASEAVSEAGFSTGGLEVAGALSSDRIAAHDLAIGRFDHASVEVFTVNWQAPDERVRPELGEGVAAGEAGQDELVRHDGRTSGWLDGRPLKANGPAPPGRPRVSWREAPPCLGQRRAPIWTTGPTNGPNDP